MRVNFQVFLNGAPPAFLKLPDHHAATDRVNFL